MIWCCIKCWNLEGKNEQCKLVSNNDNDDDDDNNNNNNNNNNMVSWVCQIFLEAQSCQPSLVLPKSCGNYYVSKLRVGCCWTGEDHTIIIIITLFNLSSIYSTNASGAEQMPETNNSNQDGYYKRGRGFEVGTNLNNSVPQRDLNSGPPNYKSSALKARPRCLL